MEYLENEYKALMAKIERKIDPIVEVEDNSFSYSFGSEEGIRSIIDVSVDVEEIKLVRYSIRTMNVLIETIMENAEFSACSNGYEVEGNVTDFYYPKDDRNCIIIVITWKITGKDNDNF